MLFIFEWSHLIFSSVFELEILNSPSLCSNNCGNITKTCYNLSFSRVTLCIFSWPWCFRESRRQAIDVITGV